MPIVKKHLDEEEQRCWLCEHYAFRYRKEPGWAYCEFYDDWFDNPFPPVGGDLMQRKEWRPPGERTCENFEW